MNSRTLSTKSTGIELSGQELLMLPERAVWWKSRETLLIADTHFGKEATFRAAAIPVPDLTSNQLERLEGLLNRTKAKRLVVLGDLIHSRAGRCRLTFDRIRQWRSARSELRIELIRGNHDRSAGDPPAEWDICCFEEPQFQDPLFLVHDSDQVTDSSTAVLCGHLHPVAALRSPSGDRARLPCFLLRGQTLTLPAFSPFVDGKVLSLRQDDQVFAVCEDRLIHLTAPAATQRSGKPSFAAEGIRPDPIPG